MIETTLIFSIFTTLILYRKTIKTPHNPLQWIYGNITN